MLSIRRISRPAVYWYVSRCRLIAGLASALHQEVLVLSHLITRKDAASGGNGLGRPVRHEVVFCRRNSLCSKLACVNV